MSTIENFTFSAWHSFIFASSLASIAAKHSLTLAPICSGVSLTTLVSALSALLAPLAEADALASGLALADGAAGGAAGWSSQATPARDRTATAAAVWNVMV